MSELTPPNIYDFSDYRKYLEGWIRSRLGGGRGERSRFAEILKCHSAYISQVFRGRADLSLEQAILLSSHFDHSESEREFFLLLVQVARAGNPTLRAFFEKQIQKILTTRLNLSQRLGTKAVLSREKQAIYYSSWEYAAVHVATSIPKLRTARTLSQEIGISVARVEAILEYLKDTGLVTESAGQLKYGEAQIHLENDSPFFKQYHTNWRLKALAHTGDGDSKNLHYASVGTFATKDRPRVREILVRAIEEIRALIRQSKEEEIHCYSMDFFKIGEQNLTR